MTICSKTILLGLVASATTAAAQPGVTIATDPVEEPEVAPAPEVRPPGEVAPRASARRHSLAPVSQGVWGGGVRLTGLSGVGALPGVNIGAELAAYLRHDEKFAEIALGHWQPQETIVVSNTPDRIELGLDVWTLRGGWASKTMPLRAWLLFESGELASSHAVSGAIARMVGAVEKDRRWLAAGGGFGVAWPMSDQARLVGTVELAVPIARTPLMMQTGGQFEPDAAAARCNLGLEVGWR